MNIVPGGSKVMRPPSSADGQLLLTLIQNDDVVSDGVSTPYVDDDANMLLVTDATTDTAWDVEASAIHFGRIAPVALSCVGSSGALTGNRVTRITDGSCTVVAGSGMFLKSQKVAMQRYVPAERKVWHSWVSGCLAADIEDNANVSLRFWSGGGFGFTAISPRHVVGCEHIYWMPAQLTLGGVTRNLVGMEYIGPNNLSDRYATDLLVGLYDGDFPAFAKVFPPDLYDYLPSLRYGADVGTKDVPAIVCNQFGERLRRTTGIVEPQFHSFGLRRYYGVDDPSDKDIIVGDSGNPGFLVVNGEPVLLGTLTGGGGGWLTTVHDQATAINAAMTSLGGGYQLTQFDLSGYPSYA